MRWLKTLFSFKGTANRPELLRKLTGCGFLVWLAALVDEQVVRPYFCSQDPLKIGCIPGEVREGFAIADNPALTVTAVLVIVPVIAVMVRRLNEHGKSGWWLLAAFTGIGLVPLLYWFLLRYPKTADQPET